MWREETDVGFNVGNGIVFEMFYLFRTFEMRKKGKNIKILWNLILRWRLHIKISKIRPVMYYSPIEFST